MNPIVSSVTAIAASLYVAYLLARYDEMEDDAPDLTEADLPPLTLVAIELHPMATSFLEAAGQRTVTITSDDPFLRAALGAQPIFVIATSDVAPLKAALSGVARSSALDTVHQFLGDDDDDDDDDTDGDDDDNTGAAEAP